MPSKTVFALLGETESECITRYGPKLTKNGDKLVFQKNNRILEIRLRDGRAVFITCTDATPAKEKLTEIAPFQTEVPFYAVDSPSMQHDWPLLGASLKLLSFLWGTPEPSALYLGMWSAHLNDPNFDVSNNWLIGYNFRGYFLGTFINSYNQRSWATGVQRSVWSIGKLDSLNTSLGYRLGLMTGYQNRFPQFYRNSPIIFFPEFYANVAFDYIGVQISYSWTVVTAGFFIRF
jgi:hypothetical protein